MAVVVSSAFSKSLKKGLADRGGCRGDILPMPKIVRTLFLTTTVFASVFFRGFFVILFFVMFVAALS